MIFNEDEMIRRMAERLEKEKKVEKENIGKTKIVKIPIVKLNENVNGRKLNLDEVKRFCKENKKRAGYAWVGELTHPDNKEDKLVETLNESIEREKSKGIPREQFKLLVTYCDYDGTLKQIPYDEISHVKIKNIDDTTTVEFIVTPKTEDLHEAFLLQPSSNIFVNVYINPKSKEYKQSALGLGDMYVRGFEFNITPEHNMLSRNIALKNDYNLEKVFNYKVILKNKL